MQQNEQRGLGFGTLSDTCLWLFQKQESKVSYKQ